MHIDQQGPDGQWRVWWLNSAGYTCERFFSTFESAKDWMEFAESLDAQA